MKSVHHHIRRAILSWIDFFYKPFKKHLPLHTFRYAACGGANTLLDICLFTISYNIIFKKHDVFFLFVTLSPHIASLFLAQCISIPTGFYLNRYVVFQQSGLNAKSQLARYLIVTGICVLLNYLFMKVLVDYLGLYPTPSKIITTLLVIVFSYTSQTYWFFRVKQQ